MPLIHSKGPSTGAVEHWVVLSSVLAPPRDRDCGQRLAFHVAFAEHVLAACDVGREDGGNVFVPVGTVKHSTIGPALVVATFQDRIR